MCILYIHHKSIFPVIKSCVCVCYMFLQTWSSDLVLVMTKGSTAWKVMVCWGGAIVGVGPEDNSIAKCSYHVFCF